MYCQLPAAFKEKKCVHCAYNERKHGPPRNCERCGLKSAFIRDPKKPVSLLEVFSYALEPFVLCCAASFDSLVFSPSKSYAVSANRFMVKVLILHPKQSERQRLPMEKRRPANAQKASITGLFLGIFWVI